MTENLPFTKRSTFIHAFQTGMVMSLQVDKTAKEIRFQFHWSPPLRNLRELEEIGEEFLLFRDHWLGKGDDMVRHDIQDFLFYQSCESELVTLIETLLP